VLGIGPHKVVGFVPTKDFTRARNFYEQLLGLEFVRGDSLALEFRAGGATIRVAMVQDFVPAPYTILGFEVPAIADVVSELSRRGVKFERYPWMKQDGLGIWDAPSGAKVAWFKDPDGNVLSVSQR